MTSLEIIAGKAVFDVFNWAWKEFGKELTKIEILTEYFPIEEYQFSEIVQYL